MVKSKKLILAALMLCILLTSIAIPATAGTVPGLPNPIVHLKFEGNGNDSTTYQNSANVISTSGETGITYITGVSGQAAKFDGASYFEIADSNSLDLLGSYTFSVWMYKEDIRPKRCQPIIEKWNAVENEDEIAYGLRDMEDSETYMHFFDENGQGSHVYSETYLDFHKWQLLTVTNDGKSVKFYVDGVLKSIKQETNSTPQSTGPLVIGYSEYDDGSFYKGVMDELMIFHDVLTPDQIKNYYNSIAIGTGKPLLDMGKKLVVHYKFQDNLQDTSGNNQNGPVGQIVGISYVPGKLGAAAKFNGSASFEVPDSDLLDLGNSFSFSLWLSKDPMGEAPDYPIIYKSKSSVGEGLEPSYALVETQGVTTVKVIDENRQGIQIYSDTLVGSDKWYHLAVTCENNVMKFYYNGDLKDTKPFKGFVPHSSGSLSVGWADWINNKFFKGTMDDLRIYNYALSAAEVKTLSVTTDKLSATPISVNALKVNTPLQLKVTLTSVETGKATDVTAAAKYTSNSKNVKVVGGKIISAVKGNAEITITYGPHIIKVPVTVK